MRSEETQEVGKYCASRRLSKGMACELLRTLATAGVMYLSCLIFYVLFMSFFLDVFLALGLSDVIMSCGEFITCAI